MSENGWRGAAACGIIGRNVERAMPPPLPSSFNRLAWSNLAAQSAEQISLAAVPIVAVLAMGAGAGQIGLLGLAQTLPFLLMSIPFGLLADRTSRRRLMVLSEALRALTLLALLAAAVTGRLSMGLLAVLGFLGAVGTVGFSVAAPAIVPSLVPRDALALANGRLEVARSIAFAAGPALAGALVSWAGAPSAFVLAAVLSGAAVALLLALREPARAPLAPRHPALELRDGALFVWRHALLRPILLTAAAWNISWFVLQAAYVPYAIRVLGLSAGQVGATLAVYGIGLTTGAMLAPRIVGAMPFGRAIQFGPVLSVAAALGIVATMAWPSGILAGAAQFVLGFGPAIWVITSITLRQTVTPDAMLGRVSAIFLTVNAGARPVGAALGGIVGASLGEGACLVLMCAGFMVQALLILCSPLRRLRELPPHAP